MKILLLGGAGETGSMVIDAALAAGHRVTALVRPGRALLERPGLTVAEGDAREAEDLVAAGPDADVLISTIGVGTSRTADHLIQDAMSAVVAAARRTGLRRIVVQSAFGTGASYRKAPLLLKLGYRYGKDVFVDKEKGEETLVASGLDWTLAYPVVLRSAAATGRYRATDLRDLDRLRGVPRIPRGDVASFLVQAASGDEWVGRIAVLHAAR